MKKTGVCLAAAAALMFVSAQAFAGPLRLVATDSKGKLAKTGKYGKWTRVYRASAVKKFKANSRKRYSVSATYCKQSLMLRPVQRRWVAAHKKAKHRVALQERKGKRYVALCRL